MTRPTMVLACLLVAPAGAQEVLWQRNDAPNSSTRLIDYDAFGDFDRDGYPDTIATYQPAFAVPSEAYIISGRDGSTLWPTLGSIHATGALVHYAGDMDGDGSPDFALVISTQVAPVVRFLQVWSPARGTLLWQVTGSQNGYFGGYAGQASGMIGNIDIDGDHRPDIIAITSSSTESDVYVYDNSGTLAYTIPVRSFGWTALSVARMPDLDGDGCDDFLLGALLPGVTGGVFVISGRTGSILRFNLDPRSGDVIGGAVTDAGDVDGDGVHDYATASYEFSPLTRIAIFSGASGALIRSWDDYWTTDSGLLGNIDVDLDGVPDLIVANGGYPVATNIWGQVRAYSGRDGNVLWNHNSVSIPNQIRPAIMVPMGVQPGSPYPVFSWLDFQWSGGVGRIVAMRGNLLGAGPVTGTGCASQGDPPLIGMRVVPGHARITVSNGPPGALAWLAGGPAAQTTYGGTPLPFPLDALGFVGCDAYVPPVVVVPTVLGTGGVDGGYTAIDLPWPSLSQTGLALAAQWLVVDPVTGFFATSPRHEFRIP